jgi:hypothetical protein
MSRWMVLLCLIMGGVGHPFPAQAEIVWGTPTPIQGLPPGWHGECRTRPFPAAYCAIWRYGPLRSRFVLMQDWDYMMSTILFDLPHRPLFVLAYADGEGYVSTPTLLIGPHARVIRSLLRDGKEVLRFRLQEGDGTRDLALPVPGCAQAERLLSLATLALHRDVVRDITQPRH